MSPEAAVQPQRRKLAVLHPPRTVLRGEHPFDVSSWAYHSVALANVLVTTCSVAALPGLFREAQPAFRCELRWETVACSSVVLH